MKLLIAEDDALLQATAENLMKYWGFDFDMVSNGAEAIDRARTNQGEYDLCLMDIDMPVMNGMEATKIIRKELRYFPIMAVTGNANAAGTYLSAGMDDYLGKPYSVSEIQQKIKELTVKSVKIYKTRDQVLIRKETPMDQKELNELKELDKKGLTKFSLIDTDYKFITHKNLQNKLSHDFIAKGKLVSEFLDRSPDDPGIVHLYAANLKANKRHIWPERLDELAAEEDREMEACNEKAEYPDSEIP